MGPWAAIALNCSLYAFAHLYKGPGEAFGSIPVGIFLCYLTLSYREYMDRSGCPLCHGTVQ